MYDKMQRMFLGFSSEIFQKVVEMVPHVEEMSEVYMTEVLALVYVLIDLSLIGKDEKRKEFFEGVKKIIEEKTEEQEYEFISDRMGFYFSIMNGSIELRGDSFAERIKKEDKENRLLRPCIAFCDGLYNLNAIYNYKDAPVLKKADLINNKKGSELLRFFRQESLDIYKMAQTL